MVTKAEIIKLVTLTRIEATDLEVEHLQQDLERILSYVSQLDRAETGAVEPLRNIMGLANEMRSDETPIQIKADVAQLVEAAPISDAGYIKVPPVKNTWS